jgi:2-oxoglutarate dehydrogenase complex dihydrolipoamide succinyltransferase (E2) component
VSSSPTEAGAAAPGREAEEAPGVVVVVMPQMGISVSEGTLLEWRKGVGDSVAADETIADVTTDKVDVEIPCPATGVVEALLIEPGETVEVGTPIAEIRDGSAAGPVDGSPPSALPGVGQTAGSRKTDIPTPPAGEVDRSSVYSPVVRRIASEHGVDLELVEGTGIGGRVRKRDLVAFIESGEPQPAKAERPMHIESPYRPEEPAAEPGTSDNGAGAHRKPMSPMRQAIARHMVESRRTAAHCTTIVEVDMHRVAERRAALREAMARKGVPLTYLAFVARAAVEALEEFPVLNSSVDGDELVLHDDVNLGIAVALEDGLIVPVIPKAQRLSLEGMAAAIAEVAERARGGGLEPDDVQGGTFTITNPGQFGAVLATPIINQPQVAILDLEAIVKRPVVVEGDAIAVRPMTFLPMSWDHRALDGATAARFLSRVKDRLEGWEAG